MPRNFQAWPVVPILTLLFCFIPILVKAVPQPLPDAITHAHTVFIENETGYNELQYVIVMELSKWGRFDLADDRDKADLILRLDSASHVKLLPEGQVPSMNAESNADIPKGCTRIALLDPKTNSMLWSDAHKTENGKVKSGHLLDGLREAFDSYEKSRR
jgi:hypothetical protein